MQKRSGNATDGTDGQGDVASSGANQEKLILAAIGKQIRARREQKGMAQETFAAHAGIDRSYYGAVERGRYSVTAINLVKIALALEVEVGDLFPSQELIRSLLSPDPKDE